MDSAKTNGLAEKLAQVISTESKQDLISIQKNLDAINARLDQLESSAILNFKSQISNSTHASLDRFAIAEAIVDNIFAQDTKEKACTFEPSKPCDHCSMCNSRGF